MGYLRHEAAIRDETSIHDETTSRVPDRLVVSTVAVPDPGDLISRLPQPQALAWVRRGDGLVGWGTAATITLPAGHDRFTAGEKWLREQFDSALVSDEVRVPGSGPVAFGSFTFDPTSDGSVLVIPKVVLARREGRSWLTTIGVEPEVPGPDPLPLSPPTSLRWSDGRLTAPDWERAVATAVRAIKAGHLRKVVLAIELCATAAQDIDARVLLARLAERYPDCYTFSCAGLLGATPELYIRRTGRQLYSLVLAGTMPRGGTPGHDAALGDKLLASTKDQEEHQYVVADVRAALTPLCSDLRVDDKPSLLKFANVQHLGTQVHGELAAGEAAQYSALALAAAVHPTAAVCGTPTETAMELIRELECMDRARWSGPVGWVDAKGNGEWGIALRCGEISGPNARLIAGCGIVAGSDPAAELAEAQTKFWPMRYALEG
ncbi:MAG TPA: isochorismate synthase [Streptosporangiaceae bacterium]|nr:isochorismate synthase [Streptosporangiaceae bacterium]